MRKLIVTPMREELDFIVQGCTKAGCHAERATVGRLPVVRLPDLGVTLGRGGLGKAQFALQTQHLLDSCSDWDFDCLCGGAAGALGDKVSVGDVVVWQRQRWNTITITNLMSVPFRNSTVHEQQ